ncbi:MAG: polyphosphate polymerase domain-containing protein [Solirubrobacterales bacterium]|nr:polyphosphate polymerase domain-containing protein [Solirubrobacterales bacterium]
MAGDLDAALARFEGVSLDELDERASLLKRVDNKYSLVWGSFLELLDRVSAEHDVLDMDGQRVFSYRTTYFDTPDLRCFTDHIEDQHPRFKARTRLYVDSDSCVFEVKLKREPGETDKRQIDYPVSDAERFTDSARQCLSEALSDAGLDAPARMAPTLQTAFRRITFAGRDSAERLTCDLEIRLSNPDGDVARMHDGLVLVETKTEEGDSTAQSILTEVGAEEISLSKYRVGMGLVGAADDAPQPGSELFS